MLICERVHSVASETTLYYYDHNWRVLAEYDGSNNIRRKFAYGNTIDEVLFMIDGDSTEYYYTHDHLHSPAVLPISASSAPGKGEQAK